MQKFTTNFYQFIIIFLLILLPQFASKTEEHKHQNQYWHWLTRNKHGDIASLWPVQNDDGRIRNALKPNSKQRWTEYRDSRRQFIISYRIVGQFNVDDELRIFKAMAIVAKNSCIRFVRWRGEANFLQIRNDRTQGCYSATVGRLPGGANIINLESNEVIQCASQLGLVLHELFHVVGLWHEHQRWDRHKYIRIHRRRALPGTKLQLMKAPRDKATRYGVRYDYRSVMHYPKDGFAIRPGLVVLETKKPYFQDIIGHAKNASPNDFLKVCAIYDCRRCMSRPFRRYHNTRPRDGNFKVLNVTEQEIRRQAQDYGYEDLPKMPMEDEEGLLEDCRCRWQGCWCRGVDELPWQWRPFDVT